MSTVMLAKPYAGQKVKHWLISEKLDGVRAIWTGELLVSRNGNIFPAPSWFLAELPAGVRLDGELYIGRGLFQDCAAIVRRKEPRDDEWRRIKYMVFDAPAIDGEFSERLDFCRRALTGSKIARLVEHVPCRGRDHLMEVFSNLVNDGAEGVILRSPWAGYIKGRSHHMLKLKPRNSDEAEVVGFQEGLGQNRGKVGALICRWKGRIFNLGAGLTDYLRRHPPVLGSLVTFNFQGVTDNGIPRFPVFVAVRDYE